MKQWTRRKKTMEFLDPDEIFADSSSILAPSVMPEGKIERSIGAMPSIIFFACIALGLVYLVSRAGSLQILRGEELFALAQENRFLSRPIFAPRGILYDDRGEPLVENVPSIGLVWNRDDFIRQEGDLDELRERLAPLLNEPDTYFDELGLAAQADTTSLPKRIFIARDLPRERLVEIASRLDALPGVEIFESHRRSYRSPYAFSNLLGFTGKISIEDLSRDPLLNTEESTGKAGIEAYYDSLLRGKGGRKIVEVDSEGRDTRYKLVRPAREGTGLNLSIDGGLQETAYKVFGDYTEGRKAGSVVAIDPRNGAIRALVSFPSVDANALSSGISQQEFKRLIENSLNPFFNRAISGEFPSGSTIKPLLAAAALEENLIDPDKKIYDAGFIEIPNPYRPGESSRFVDWRKHGWVDFYDAIAYSANVYFYMIGGGYLDQKGLGIERIKKYASAFGLGSRLNIDLPGEKSGFLPDPETKKITDPDDPIWRVGDTYNVSIGQGGVKVTPLQMAALTAAIANGGKVYRPYVLEAVRDKNGKPVNKTSPTILHDGIIKAENLVEVVAGMRRTVTHGTAPSLSNLPVPTAAKTGTAQSAPGKPPHAWITAFAPVGNPEIAIAVMIEYGGEGATAAGPITREILNWYFTHR